MRGNVAHFGGAINARDTSVLLLEGSLLEGNYAGLNGGAVHLKVCSWLTLCLVVLAGIATTFVTSVVTYPFPAPPKLRVPRSTKIEGLTFVLYHCQWHL